MACESGSCGAHYSQYFSAGKGRSCVHKNGYDPKKVKKLDSDDLLRTYW